MSARLVFIAIGGNSLMKSKELASSLLANQLDAGLLIISTALEQVALDFGKPAEKPIRKMTVTEAEQFIAEEHFAPGSMLPKIQSALRFLKKRRAGSDHHRSRIHQDGRDQRPRHPCRAVKD